MPQRNTSKRESQSGAPVRGRPPPPEKIFGLPRLVVAGFTGLIFALLLVGLLTLIGNRPDDEVGTIRLPDQGRRHLAIGESFESYNSTPPTSGPHHTIAAAPGAYGNNEPEPFDKQPAPGEVVALLEQGGLALYYDPDVLPRVERDALRDFVERLRPIRPLLLLIPVKGLTSDVRPPEGLAPIVATAWRHILPIAAFDEEGRDTLAQFVRPAPDGFYERFILDAEGRAATLTRED